MNEKIEGKWVSTITLPCLDGEVMVGSPEGDQKAAEKSAAKNFLDSKRDEIIVMNADARPIVVREPRAERDNGEPKEKKQKQKQKPTQSGPDLSKVDPQMLKQL